MQIDKRIGKIKVQLAAIGQMRPGSLTRQYKDPASASGAYYQLSFTLDMKSRTDYIPRNWVPQVRSPGGALGHAEVRAMQHAQLLS